MYEVKIVHLGMEVMKDNCMTAAHFLQKTRVPRTHLRVRGTVYEEMNACARALRFARKLCLSRTKTQS